MAETRKQRKILVAVDEGEESSFALTWCLHNVVVHDHHLSYNKDTLILLYARKFPSLLWGKLNTSAMISTMKVKKNGILIRKTLNWLILRLKITVETVIESGDARDVICQVAENCNVDLVVLGSHGYGVFKRAFLGSVSNHCAQNLKCPVLIVKHPKSDATK